MLTGGGQRPALFWTPWDNNHSQERRAESNGTTEQSGRFGTTDSLTEHLRSSRGARDGSTCGEADLQISLVQRLKLDLLKMSADQTQEKTDGDARPRPLNHRRRRRHRSGRRLCGAGDSAAFRPPAEAAAINSDNPAESLLEHRLKMILGPIPREPFPSSPIDRSSMFVRRSSRCLRWDVGRSPRAAKAS